MHDIRIGDTWRDMHFNTDSTVVEIGPEWVTMRFVEHPDRTTQWHVNSFDDRPGGSRLIARADAGAAIDALHDVATAGGSKVSLYDTKVTVRLGDLRACLATLARVMNLGEQSNERTVHWIGVAGEQSKEVRELLAALAAEKAAHATTEAEFERCRVQLAGCSAAATGGCETAERGAYGWSASYQDVADLHCEFDKVRRQLADTIAVRDALSNEVDRLRRLPVLADADIVATVDADDDAGIRANPASYAPGALAESLADVPSRPIELAERPGRWLVGWLVCPCGAVAVGACPAGAPLDALECGTCHGMTARMQADRPTDTTSEVSHV